VRVDAGGEDSAPGAGYPVRRRPSHGIRARQPGVDRMWIVDPKKRRIHVLRPESEPTVAGERQFITDPKILPAFRAKVRALFDI
jgi:hypothetical protein